MPELQTQEHSGVSKTVHSNQQGCHPQLTEQVTRHLANAYRKPPAQHTVNAFNAVSRTIDESNKPLILDSFCGTGMSTALLAERHPEHLVIGLDQSGHRLAKHRGKRDNYLLVQAECGDFWRLLRASGHTLSHHYLLYPNPWPKKSQLQRRVHGSADWPALLDLGGEIELRSNWNIYVEEFSLGLHLAGFSATISQLTHTEPLTLFEKKYQASGHALWCCQCTLGADSRSKQESEV